MSEYVLGRILPVFRGSYEVGTTYNKLDLVYVAGYGTYVAKTTVSSVQPESHPEIWQIVSKDITSQEVSELFNENESVRNQMVQTLIDNADEDIQNAITTLTNEITEKLNEVDGKIDGKIDELDGIKSTYTNQFNTLITDQTNTFNSNEEQRESKLDNAITTIQNADTTFKNGLQSEVHEFINTTDAEFEESQRERESEFNSTINSMNTQFNAAQSNRATTFNNSQTERNTQFNQSQTERNTQFTTQMTNQQNEFDSKEAERDLATQAIINEHQALLDLDEKKANKDGYYVEMTTGFTEQLLSPDGITDEEPYIYRTSAGSTSISTGVAEIKSLYGNSIVWNQLSYMKDELIVQPTSYAYIRENYVSTTPYINHKIYYSFEVYGNWAFLIAGNVIESGTNTEYKRFDGIYTITRDYNVFYGFSAYYGKELVEIGSKNVLIFDLTQMFGEGNEPTIEQFKQWFPLDYYEYNAGEIVNVNIDGLRTIGFNQWDEEWERGGISLSNGQNVDSTSSIRSKNFTKILPNRQYYFHSTLNQSLYVFWYDTNNSFIKATLVDDGYNGRLKISPNNAEYVRFYAVNYTTSYNNDIAINLSWSGYRNGDYEAYTEHNISIPVKEIKDADNNVLFPDGLKSAGSVKDEVTSDKAVKRIGVVDLGDLNWIPNGFGAYSAIVNGINNATPYDYNLLAIGYTLDYRCVTNTGIAPNMTISNGNNDGKVFIKDERFTSSDKAKEILQGQYLYYELATPIEVNFKDVPQSFGDKLNLTYFVDDFGTEEFTTTEPTAPVKHSTFYMTNLRDKIRNIDGNTDSGALMNNSLTNLLSTLSNALGGTLTKVWDSNNKVWQFTFTPNQTNGGLNNE